MRCVQLWFGWAALADESLSTTSVLNPFIERNADNVLRLFTTLSVAPIRPVDDCFTADSRSVFSDVALRELDSDYKLVRARSTG